MLNALGASPKLAEDGIMGTGTKNAIILFQAQNGLATDGVAGPKTLDAMRAKYYTLASKATVANATTIAPQSNALPVAPAQNSLSSSDQTKKYIMYGAIGLGSFFILLTVLSMFKKPKASA